MDTKPVVDTTPPAGSATGDAGYDAFANLFDELAAAPATKHEDTTTAPTAVDAAAAAVKVPDVAAVVEPPKEVPLVAAVPTAEIPDTTDTAATPVVPVAEAPAPAVPVDWKAKYDELAAERARAAAAPELTPEKPAAVTPPPAPPVPELYTPDEKEILEAYGKEWPDVSRGEALRRRAEYRELASFIFNEVSRVYGPVILQAQQTTEQVADNTLLGFVQRHHQDYDDAMYDDIEAWVGGLSGMRKKVATAALKDGEPEDVVELITEFKQATGRKPVVVAPAEQSMPPPAKPGAVVKPELSDAAKKAAKAMGGVDSKRSAVTHVLDPNDFDGAWAEATANAK